MDQDRLAKLHSPEAKAKRRLAPTMNPLEKALANPGKLRAAINGKCWDCQGGDSDPAPKRRIGDCQQIACALHSVRPYQ